ncbi:UDP-N-acetylmuramoyl-tripeptide--D-alanyl-D-alanine ligase [Patescibacteria group bacterium]
MNSKRTLLIKLLVPLAKRVLKKYNPKIVAVTGSVGKTSTKDVIALVLRKKYQVWESKKNYNNEIGVPLTIVGGQEAGNSLIKWFVNFVNALSLIVKRQEYPDVLVLEMAADRPGDIDYLTKLFPPDVSVITAIGPSHLEYFKTIDKVIEEKSAIVRNIKADGTAIFNIDDEAVERIGSTVEVQKISFGVTAGADVYASDIRFTNELTEAVARDVEMAQLERSGQVTGLQFNVTYGHERQVPVFLPRALGAPQTSAALAGIAVGVALEMPIADCISALGEYRPVPGRLTLIAGLKDSTIIDDTYNSAPQSALAALEVLRSMPVKGQRIAVLGDMLELGEYEQEGHEEVGKKVAQVANRLITVGARGKLIADAALQVGMPIEQVASVSNSTQVEQLLQNDLQPGDTVLIKGSQGVHMEHAVKDLMANPLQAKDLLVRQGREWRKEQYKNRSNIPASI